MEVGPSKILKSHTGISSMDSLDGGRRYTGYDEYEGIFGALGSHSSSRGTSRSLARNSGRLGMPYGDGTDVASRGFRPSRRSGTRRSSGVLSTNGYERRQRYLTERTSKRRLKPVDGDGGDDEVPEPSAMAQPSPSQIWLPTKNFSFRQRAGKLDTRTIARLDLEKIVATTDVETIQRHLENLAFSDVTLEDVQHYSDAYFLKLFQIAQLTLEYLLNVQDSLASHCESLETQCDGLADDCQTLENENEKVEGEIAALKKEIRQKQSTLATFEVMLLNATAAKRAQGIRLAQHQEADQENGHAILNILGPQQPQEESGAVPLVSACVLCGKKFISPEYLVRHQNKKHSSEAQKEKRRNKKKKRAESASPSESDSHASRSGSESSKTKSKRKRREPQTAPLSAEVIQALTDRNELAKQLMELQFQLQKEKEKRAEEVKLAEQQQSQLVGQLTSYMAKLQDTLVDMEKKQEQSKHEMMRYTQETIERMKNERIDSKKSHAGQLLSDEEDENKAKKPASPEDVEKRILDSLLRAQAEIHQKNSELELANRKLQSKLKRKTRQLQFEPPTSTLMSMSAMDAQRYGIDTGLILEEKPHTIPKAVSVEDKPVQTDEEREEPRKKVVPVQTQQVQTEAVTEVAPKPVDTLERRGSLPILKKLESKPPPPTTAPDPTPDVVPKPEPKTVDEGKSKLVEGLKAPPPAAVHQHALEVNTKSESKLQHAAQLVGKVALGFLARRTLRNPSNWLLSIPRTALAVALSEAELNLLIERQGGTLQDVTVEIEDDMTANDLRVEFAEALSGYPSDQPAQDASMPIDYHRVLLHHRVTGQEISGDQFIYHLRSQLEVEIIPHFDAAESHISSVLSFHDEVSSQIKDVRRASMDFRPGELPFQLPHNSHDASQVFVRAATRIQSVVRRFLAIRTVEMMKIDLLVEARLLSMRSLTSSPRKSSRSIVQTQQRLTRSTSIVTIHEETSDEKVVREKAEQIHSHLADVVRQKTGIDTRTKSAKWPRGQLSTEDYERHVQEIVSSREELSPELRKRVAEISERLDILVDQTYDPVAVKQAEQEYSAATKIQLAVQVAVARKKLKQLLGRREEAQAKTDSNATIEKEKLSLQSQNEEQEKPDIPEEVDEEKQEQQHDDGAENLDVEEELDEADIKRLADAYEQAAESKDATTPTVVVEDKPISTIAEDAKHAPEEKEQLPPRPGTPPPHREDLMRRSPRPKEETHVISPFSKTPLLSRRPAASRRGSGYDNAR